MTRRQVTAAAAAALVAYPATAKLVASSAPFAAADPPTAPQTGPTVDQLINLAEHGGDTVYYGRVFGICLAQTGPIAKDNGDGTISTYSPEGGHSWRKRTVRSSLRPIPVGLLTHVKPENRGSDFPAGVPFRVLG